MRKLRLAPARSLPDAIAFLKAHPADAKVIAGGCDLLHLVKGQVIKPDHLVSLRPLGATLRHITAAAGGLAVGALTTMRELETHAVVRERYTALAEAASVVASPQIRNVGTLGGNICQRPWCWYFRRGFPCFKNGGDTCFSITGDNTYNAILGGGPSFIVHPSDTAPALVALGAEVVITASGGARTLDLERFFVLPRTELSRENVLEPGDIVTELRLPAPAAGTRSTYMKISERAAWDHAIVSVAAAVTRRGETCERARIVLGGVAPIPWRVPEAERLVAGTRIDERVAHAAGEAALAGAMPLKRNAYKIDLAKRLVARALLSLA